MPMVIMPMVIMSVVIMSVVIMSVVIMIMPLFGEEGFVRSGCLTISQDSECDREFMRLGNIVRRAQKIPFAVKSEKLMLAIGALRLDADHGFFAGH